MILFEQHFGANLPNLPCFGIKEHTSEIVLILIYICNIELLRSLVSVRGIHLRHFGTNTSRLSDVCSILGDNMCQLDGICEDWSQPLSYSHNMRRFAGCSG